MDNKVQLIGITPAELAAIIVKEMGNNGILENGIFTRKEAAEFLRVSPVTLWKWTKEGKVMSHKIGGRLYYRKNELDNNFK